MGATFRKQVTFLIDPDLLDEFKNTFPGLNQSSKINIALRNFIRMAMAGEITTTEVNDETQRVINRRLGKDQV